MNLLNAVFNLQTEAGQTETVRTERRKVIKEQEGQDNERNLPSLKRPGVCECGVGTLL